MQEGWHRYWAGDAWRAWSMQRRALSLYRRTVRVMRRRLVAVDDEARTAEAERALAERNLAWVAALEPCDLGIELEPGELGLGVVEDAFLFERRLARWVPVGSGPMLVTDRRLVLDGSRQVSLPLDRIRRQRRSRRGWTLSLSARRPTHVVAGPVDRLMVVHQALVDGAAGTDPRRRWVESRNQANRRLMAVRSVRDAMRAQHRSLERPERPLSPAWVPAGILVAIGAASAVSTSIGTEASLTGTPPPTVLSVQITTTTTGRIDGTAAAKCHPSYVGACVPVDVVDVDCRGGDGDGPYYVDEVEVVGEDEYRLDPDGDGTACEE